MAFEQERIQVILKKLEDYLYLDTLELEGFVWKDCGYKAGSEMPAVDETWQAFHKGDRWGGQPDTHRWFYKHIDLPESLRGKAIDLCVRTGREGEWDAINPQFAVYIDGRLEQGLDVNHTSVRLDNRDSFDLFLYAYAGMQGGYLEMFPSIRLPDPVCEKLYYHLKVPLDVLAFTDPNSKQYADIAHYLWEAVNRIDLRVPGSSEFRASLGAAADFLDREFYGRFCTPQEAATVGIGHTHIDVAWLWTLAQTREKAQRSFATVVKLMKQYPAYKFMSSQAQLYKYVKEEDPVLYAEIKELVKAGRWEVEGAMWVEADCNLSSGESLVRQVMHGKRFFKEEFGVDSHILWLPDVFGYSAALPQILQKSGVDRFVTSKISWNETNQMPYDVFMWEGIDGTEIFSYFLTAQNRVRGQAPTRFTTYVGTITPAMVAGTWDRFQQKELTDEALLTFGYGDGGGGPTREMLETHERLQHGIPGCPVSKIDTAAHFLDTLEARVRDNPHLPRWVGELYLEMHRGTYTSIAKNKRNNRKSEFLYQTTEWLSAMDAVLGGMAYPAKELYDGWETILLNQFHDIIPGSSIKEVYADSDRQYAAIQERAKSLLMERCGDIAARVKTGGGLLVFNPHSFVHSGAVKTETGLVYAENIPAKGYKVIPNTPQHSAVAVDGSCIENQYFKVVFDGSYDISSIYDKRSNREVIKAGGRANVIQAFEDYPREYDAWEITDYYKEKLWEVSEVVGAQPIREGIRAGIAVTKRFLDSTITQNIWLYDDIARIDFDTAVDWKQEHILLKTAFPLDIHTDKATYDIQFGTVERPTHHNTSWDAAKFEVCAYKFADVSEDGYGVSLLNDCKYGYDTVGSTLRLTILKSATYPNPEADKCIHTFTYSLFPHAGSFREAGTVQMAYDVNLPMWGMPVGAQDGDLPDCYSLMEVDCENIFVETVKRAEDSDAFIFRLYDCFNRRSTPTVHFGFDVREAAVCDLMENDIDPLAVTANSVTVPVKPFEIVTIKVKCK